MSLCSGTARVCRSGAAGEDETRKQNRKSACSASSRINHRGERMKAIARSGGDIRMTSASLLQIILGLYVDEDGKDDDTSLYACINLADCSQIAHLELSSWKLDKPGAGNKQPMDVDSRPSRGKMESDSRLRFRWSPRGRDSFDGHATVEIEYDDGVRRTYEIKNVQFGKDKEWYVFPLSDSGD
jgi:hypothetical protein